MEKTAEAIVKKYFPYITKPSSIKRAVKAMEQYASQFKQPSEWISVEDRLPNHDADILFYDFGYNERKIHQAIFVTKDLFHRANMFISSEGGYFDLSHVTHWQPLPTPPSK